MFKTTVTAWLVRLAITWLGAGVIALLVADYVLRSNVEAVGIAAGEVTVGIARLEAALASQADRIAALQAALAAAVMSDAPAEPDPPADQAPAEATMPGAPAAPAAASE